MLTRGTGNTGGIFKDVAAMVNAGSKNGRRLELYDGTRYQVSSTDDGGGVLLSTGNFANKVNTPDVDGLLSRVNMDNVNLTNLDAPLFQGFQPNKLTAVSAPSGTDSDVTHTRAGTATYIDRYDALKTAGIDELRETADGYQIEAIGSTNSLLWSEEFNQPGVWGLSSASVTANQAISPDGNMAADLLSPDGADCTIFQSITSTPNTKTFSVWLKATTPIPVNMNILFSTSSKSIIVSDKWERFDISSEDVNDVAVFIGGVGQWPDGEDIYAWGAQLEDGNLSSYIPTTDAPATRAPDIVSIPYENNVPRGDQPYTIIFKGIVDEYDSSSKWLFGNESNDKGLRVSSIVSTTGQIYHYNGYDTVATSLPITAGVEFTYIVTSDGINYASYLNGVLQELSSVTSPATGLPNEMQILQGYSSNNNANGKCSLFKTLPYAITADEVKLIS